MDNNPVITEQVAVPAKNSKGNIWIIAAVVLVVLMIAAGLYLYMTGKSASEMSKAQTSSQTQKDLDNIDTELNSIDTGDIDKDLSDIDRDLSTL